VSYCAGAKGGLRVFDEILSVRIVQRPVMRDEVWFVVCVSPERRHGISKSIEIRWKASQRSCGTESVSRPPKPEARRGR